MSRKSKLLRFAELDSFTNAYQCTDPESQKLRRFDNTEIEVKGNWNKEVFHNSNPLIIELACGKGEYTVSLAQAHPEVNYIGIDIKGNRMHRGAKKALVLGMKNAAFLRIRIEWIMNHFGPGELAEIWITFPDPFLKNSKANRRLTSPVFLDRYKILLKKEGIAHLKTDSPELYKYTLETLKSYPGIQIINESENIDQDGLTKNDLAIQTYYEGMHRAEGKSIKYVSWKYQ
ncbi:MAG: tRNA (guanosine(46)-N7)-methyltransferase TrmB [Saprospiraceae bacterium]|nr:tRNA (guanosine(46)-N7)-methyltransferase TrmB [Saprospiraceae bacterium]